MENKQYIHTNLLLYCSKKFYTFNQVSNNESEQINFTHLIRCQTMKVKPYMILNTSRKNVNYEEVPMNKPYNIQNTNICNGIFHISFFKALLINEGEQDSWRNNPDSFRSYFLLSISSQITSQGLRKLGLFWCIFCHKQFVPN